MSQKEVIEILKKYLFLLKSEGIPVDRAYLYGSYLLNSATTDSDIDLMIVTENENDDYLVGKVWSLSKEVNSKIEPLLVDKSRFENNDSSPLIELVKQKGLLIE